MDKTKQLLKWIHENKNIISLYKYLLNLSWQPEEKDIVLDRLRLYAIELKERPHLIKELIRGEGGWRPTLVGNAIAILLRAREFESDLIWRLSNWSWVAPQVAAGIAILSGPSTEKDLEPLLKNAMEESDPKIVLSTYSALKFIGSPLAEEFESGQIFKTLKDKDRDSCLEIARTHWNFWKEVEPIAD